MMVRSDGISTHDVTRGSIPFKDQVLAINHTLMSGIVTPSIGTSQIDIPDLQPSSVVIAAENLTQIPVENVLRAYNCKSSTETSLYQAWLRGETEFSGHPMPENLVANGKLPYIMDTPSTKSDEHDESVSPEWLFKNGICTPEQYMQIRNSSIAAFGAVSLYLSQKGIILADTKTEHGITVDGRIVSQDELYTMDSSRFWLRDDYMKQLEDDDITELNPKSYSKEFARGMSKGKEGYTDEQRAQIAVRYIEGIQQLTGQRFEPDMRSSEERIISGLRAALIGLNIDPNIAKPSP